jgi:hypothetical protein
MIVVDDVQDTFGGVERVREILKNSFTSLRPGGRIEVITPETSAHAQRDWQQLLSEAGYKPVRILAERSGLRFVEGLRPNS